MINSNRWGHDGVAHDFALLSLRLLWCSDCHTDQLFERPQADVTNGSSDSSSNGEWACTDCGAAYFDAIDIVLETAGSARSVG